MVVYLLNLNDILPSGRQFKSDSGSWIAFAKEKLSWLDGLRGKSYLWSVVRSQVRLFLARMGYGYQGWVAAELFPTENASAVRDTAERINQLAEALDRRGVAFEVILLPYEMQISREAARRYWEAGIRWEDKFLDGLTQRMLIENFADSVRYFDARLAFLAPGDTSGSPSESIGVGQYFCI